MQLRPLTNSIIYFNNAKSYSLLYFKVFFEMVNFLGVSRLFCAFHITRFLFPYWIESADSIVNCHFFYFLFSYGWLKDVTIFSSHLEVQQNIQNRKKWCIFFSQNIFPTKNVPSSNFYARSTNNTFLIYLHIIYIKVF